MPNYGSGPISNNTDPYVTLVRRVGHCQKLKNNNWQSNFVLAPKLEQVKNRLAPQHWYRTTLIIFSRPDKRLHDVTQGYMKSAKVWGGGQEVTLGRWDQIGSYKVTWGLLTLYEVPWGHKRSHIITLGHMKPAEVIWYDATWDHKRSHKVDWGHLGWKNLRKCRLCSDVIQCCTVPVLLRPVLWSRSNFDPASAPAPGKKIATQI